jgi:hypothetical protein
MPSLFSFLPTVNPAKALFHNESGNAPIACFGISIREEHKNLGLFAVRNPKFAAIDDKVIAAVNRTGLHGKRIRA